MKNIGKFLYIVMSIVILLLTCCCKNEQKEQGNGGTDSIVVVEQEEKEESEEKVEKAEKIVYITPTGKRYHYKKTCAGKNAKEITLIKASKKYTGCQKCTR